MVLQQTSPNPTEAEKRIPNSPLYMRPPKNQSPKPKDSTKEPKEPKPALDSEENNDPDTSSWHRFQEAVRIVLNAPKKEVNDLLKEEKSHSSKNPKK